MISLHSSRSSALRDGRWNGIVKTFKLIVHLTNGTNFIGKTMNSTRKRLHCDALHLTIGTRREIDLDFDRREGVKNLVCKVRCNGAKSSILLQ